MLNTCVVVPMLTWYDKLLSHSVIHIIKTVKPKSENELAKISRDTPAAHNTTNSVRFVYVAFLTLVKFWLSDLLPQYYNK